MPDFQLSTSRRRNFSRSSVLGQRERESLIMAAIQNFRLLWQATRNSGIAKVIAKRESLRRDALRRVISAAFSFWGGRLINQFLYSFLNFLENDWHSSSSQERENRTFFIQTKIFCQNIAQKGDSGRRNGFFFGE